MLIQYTTGNILVWILVILMMSFGPVNIGPTNNQLSKCRGPSTTCVYTMVNIWTKLSVNATMIDKVLTLLHDVIGVVYSISTRNGYPFVPKNIQIWECLITIWLRQCTFYTYNHMCVAMTFTKESFVSLLDTTSHHDDHL